MSATINHSYVQSDKNQASTPTTQLLPAGYWLRHFAVCLDLAIKAHLFFLLLLVIMGIFGDFIHSIVSTDINSKISEMKNLESQSVNDFLKVSIDPLVSRESNLNTLYQKTNPLVLICFGVFFFLLNLLYNSIFEATRLQATPGKLLFRIRVVNYQDQKISHRQSIVRQLSKILSSIPLMIGFIMAMGTPKKQALHDMVSKTLVVRNINYTLEGAFIIFFFSIILNITTYFYPSFWKGFDLNQLTISQEFEKLSQKQDQKVANEIAEIEQNQSPTISDQEDLSLLDSQPSENLPANQETAPESAGSNSVTLANLEDSWDLQPTKEEEAKNQAIDLKVNYTSSGPQMQIITNHNDYHALAYQFDALGEFVSTGYAKENNLQNNLPQPNLTFMLPRDLKPKKIHLVKILVIGDFGSEVKEFSINIGEELTKSKNMEK